MNKTLQKNQLKSIVKSAITEIIEDNGDLIREIIEEAVESAFMVKSIKQGKKSKKISRKRVFDVLSKRAA